MLVMLFEHIAEYFLEILSCVKVYIITVFKVYRIHAVNDIRKNSLSGCFRIETDVITLIYVTATFSSTELVLTRRVKHRVAVVIHNSKWRPLYILQNQSMFQKRVILEILRSKFCKFLFIE